MVLIAHQNFLFDKIDLFNLFKSILLIFDVSFDAIIENIFAFNIRRYFFVSLFEQRHKSKDPKISFAALCIKNHLLNVLEVILALIIIKKIFNFLASIIKFGQISEFTKNIAYGSHNRKNLLIKKSISAGKICELHYEVFLFPLL